MEQQLQSFFRKQIYLAILCASIACSGVASAQSLSPSEEFRTFVDTYLGAKKEPLRYVYSGETLAFIPESEWTHVSENSVAVAFETTLPSKTYVEYGTTPSFGKRTTLDDRFTSLHLHHLAGLQMGQRVYFRFVAEDERGITIRSTVREATPAAIPGAKHIPGDVAGPPYVLTQAGYYVVTADVNAPTRGFTIKTSGVTLDLN